MSWSKIGVVSKPDIEDDTELDIAVRVVDVDEWDHDSIAYKLTCRDIERNRLEVTAFHNDEISVDRWDRGDWYKIQSARGNIYRGEPALTLNYGNCEIEELNGPPVEAAGNRELEERDGPESISDIADRPLADTVRTTTAHTSVPDEGTYLSQFSVDVDELSVHRYDLDLSGNGWNDLGTLVNKLANALWRRTGVPTSQYSDFSIVTTEPVTVDTVSAYGDEADLQNHEEVTVSPAANPGVVRNLVIDAIKNALEGDERYRVEGIYSVESVRPRQRSDDGRFEAADEYDIGVTADSGGNVLASIETSYSLRSGVSVAELIGDTSIQLQGLYAEHVTAYGNYASGRIAYVDRKTRYTDPLTELGGDSVADYHRQESRAPDALIDEIASQNPPLVYIYYSNGSDPLPQAPHFLRLSPSLDVLSSLDQSFLYDITDEMKQEPEERFERAAWFAGQIDNLDDIDVSVGTTPRTAPTHDGTPRT